MSYVIVACTLWMLILMVVSEIVVRFFVVSFFEVFDEPRGI